MKAPVEKKIWFPAKRYGWGWGPPNCWQRWVVMLLWLALVFASTFLLNQHLAWAVVCMGGLVLLLILICLWNKGVSSRVKWRAGRFLENAHRRVTSCAPGCSQLPCV